MSDIILNAFNQFKAANDERLANIENQIDRTQATVNRTGLMIGGAPENSGHLKAFKNWAKTGNETGLLTINNAMSEGSNADGGFTVPVELDNNIAATMTNINVMRQLADVVQVTTPNYQKLISIHGTASGWVGETAARSTTNSPQFAQILPFMGELYANPKATQQLLDDGIGDVGKWLEGEIALQFAVAEGSSFTTGDGTTKPKGFLSYTLASTADGVRAFGSLQYIPTGAAADFLTASATVSPADVLLDMVYALKAQHRNGASWQMNKQSVAKIRKVKDTVGDYIWTPPTSEGIATGQAGLLLGYPVYENEDMASFGANAYPVAFGNWKAGYCIVDRVGTRILRDPYTDRPYINFYSTKRVGGMVVDSEAIKVLKCAVS